MSDTTHVYLVIEVAYGAVRHPDSIWSDGDDAIERARDLADEAEYKPMGDGYKMEGHAKNGVSSFQVHKREVQR